jgi:CBS domain-containing protein
MKIRDILKSKNGGIITIEPEKTVREAMNVIAEKKIGALLVMEDRKLVGIITERDIFRLVVADGEKAFSKKVGEVMTRNLVIGIPDDDMDTAMAYITNNRFRHLPIIDDQEVVGIISIGDLIKCQVHNLKVENRYLMDYITGKYPG